MDQKQCLTCKEVKPLDQFHKGNENRKGRIPHCKSCYSLKMAKKYKEDWFSFQARLKKSESKKKGIPFDLTADYLRSIWTDTCPVFCLPFVQFDKTHPFNPHLDRIDPSKGYTKGNVCYISQRANRIKYDATPDELRKVLNYVEGATTIPKGSTLK